MEPVTAYLIAFTILNAFIFLAALASYVIAERLHVSYGLVIGWVVPVYLTLLGTIFVSKDYLVDSKSVVVTECKERTITELTWKK